MVANVCVDKSVRGLGVGSQLIHHVIEAERRTSQKEKVASLQLSTDNPGAKRIYEKAGFTFDPILKDVEGDAIGSYLF